jgi:hypothetical protein
MNDEAQLFTSVCSVDEAIITSEPALFGVLIAVAIVGLFG